MTRRELQALVGFEIGPKMEMVAGPDGTVYGRLEDGSWEAYPPAPPLADLREADA